MGELGPANMMFRSILVAIALVASAHAVPTPNDIVPETKFVASAHASAKQIMTDSSYQTAHLTYNTAVTTLATAKTTYTLSVTAHTEAVTEAARLKLECECATQSAHAV